MDGLEAVRRPRKTLQRAGTDSTPLLFQCASPCPFQAVFRRPRRFFWSYFRLHVYSLRRFIRRTSWFRPPASTAPAAAYGVRCCVECKSQAACCTFALLRVCVCGSKQCTVCEHCVCLTLSTNGFYNRRFCGGFHSAPFRSRTHFFAVCAPHFGVPFLTSTLLSFTVWGVRSDLCAVSAAVWLMWHRCFHSIPCRSRTVH